MGRDSHSSNFDGRAVDIAIKYQTVPFNVPSCRILLFADDVRHFAWVSSKRDCDALQSSINSFSI